MASLVATIILAYSRKRSSDARPGEVLRIRVSQISLTNLVNNTLQEKHPLLHRTRSLPAFAANNNSLPAPHQTQRQRQCLGHRTSLLPGHLQLTQWQD